MTAPSRREEDPNGIRIGIVSGELPSLKGDGLVPLRMEPPATHGGLEPISFAAGLEPINEQLLREGRVVSSRPVGEQRELDLARKRSHDLGLLQ